MDVDLRLYALIDPAVAGGRTLSDLAQRIAGSATLVQLRDKHGSTRALVEEARELTVELAMAAPLEHLDYVAIGGVYGTTSKADAKAPIGIEGLRAVAQAIRARDR